MVLITVPLSCQSWLERPCAILSRFCSTGLYSSSLFKTETLQERNKATLQVCGAQDAPLLFFVPSWSPLPKFEPWCIQHLRFQWSLSEMKTICGGRRRSQQSCMGFLHSQTSQLSFKQSWVKINFLEAKNWPQILDARSGHKSSKCVYVKANETA